MVVCGSCLVIRSRLCADGIKFAAGRQLALAYQASTHGWSALQFHQHCDSKGPCVVYGVTDSGARFGGFNDAGFRSTDDYAASLDAFLFCWPGSAEEPILLGKVKAAADMLQRAALTGIHDNTWNP